jgi:hypothetical protein
MKTIGAGLVLLALTAVVGCSGSPTSAHQPGGATDKATNKPIIGQAEGEFELKPPKTTQTVKHGETTSVEITIDRGKNTEAGDVTLTFHGPDGKELPKGVTIKPDKPIIKAANTGIKVDVEADKEAAVGKHDIQIIGKPEKGKEAKATMTIDVK